MEETSLILCDSDILIEVLDRNNQKIIDLLLQFDVNQLCISSISFSEIIYGAANKKHQKKLLSNLEKFILIEISSSIDSIHRNLMLNYSMSHKLKIQDALIAASALYYDIPLITLNKKDFTFIKGLQLI
ncbi:MAG TPA: PIN domain-containing protein [Cyclobacteriaceae bacterium]